MKQFIGEAFMVSLLALALAILLADLLLSPFEQLTNKSFVLWSMDNWILALAAMAILIATTLISGLYPATIVARFNPVKSMKGKEKLGGSSWISKSLIVLQFMIGMVFLTGLFVINKQLKFIQNFDKGYNDEGLVSLEMPRENNAQLVGIFKEKLLSYPYVKHIGGNTGSGWSTSLEHNDQTYEVNHDKIGPDFFRTLGVELVKGRNFDADRPADKQKVIVNEALVAQLGLKNPIGETIAFNYFETMENPEIIGVVSNYNYTSLHSPVEPMVYYMHSDRALGQLFIKIDEQYTSETIALLTATSWREAVPRQPLSYSFVEEQNMQQYEKELQQAEMIEYASFLAILLSCLGLFGLATLHIRQRNNEIGVRKVLGASIPSILVTLSKHFILLVLVALMVAIPFSSWLANTWLENFTYKTNLPAWLFVVAGLAMTVLAIASIAYQVIKTAMVNPVDSIRNE